MGIIAWPDGVQMGKTARCALCGSWMALEDLSAGMCDLKGVQKFACNSHFRDLRFLIVAWADFEANQYWVYGTDKNGKTIGDFDDV